MIIQSLRNNNFPKYQDNPLFQITLTSAPKVGIHLIFSPKIAKTLAYRIKLPSPDMISDPHIASNSTPVVDPCGGHSELVGASEETGESLIKPAFSAFNCPKKPISRKNGYVPEKILHGEKFSKSRFSF